MRSTTTALLLLLTSCAPEAPPAPAPSATPQAQASAPSAAPPASAAAPAPACERPSKRAELAPLDAPAGGGIVLAKLGARTVALVADADTKLVHTVDLGERRELARTAVAGEPAALLVTPDGRVAVALRDRGALQLLDAGPTPDAPLVPICETAVPAEPVALAFAPADRERGGALLVVSRWAAQLTALGLPDASGSWARRGSWSLERDPVAIVVTKERAVVLHAVGGVVDDLPLAALAQARDGANGPPAPAARVGGRDPAVSPQAFEGTQGYGLAADPTSGRVFAALALALARGEEGNGYGGTEHAMRGEIAVLEPDGELRGSPFAPRGGAGDCLLPRAAAFDRERGLVLVACAGIDVLAAFDARAEDPALRGPRKDGRSAPLPAERRTPRQFERWRAKVGAGPSAVAVDAKAGRAWVWGAFDGTLTEVSVGGKSTPSRPLSSEDELHVDPSRAVGALRLRTAPALPPAVELGRALFHAGGPKRRVASDGRACASCHLDGRDDGITWMTSEGPRQTPVLLGRIEGTAPYGWEGDEPLDGHFRRTLRRLGGTGLSTEERDAIFAYVASLRLPGAGPTDAAKALAARGAEVFASAAVGCATCHPGGAGVDGMQHDVKSRAPLDRPSRFDTPSLRFVGRSAPYFHDGRYATLEALLEGTSGTMGHTKQLSATDRAALLAFLESL